MSPPGNPNVHSRSIGREDLARDQRRLKPRRPSLQSAEDQVGRLLARIVPGAAIRKVGRELLADEVRKVRPGGCEAVSTVEGIRISTIGALAMQVAPGPVALAVRQARSI